jgi:hypothetical protein
LYYYVTPDFVESSNHPQHVVEFGIANLEEVVLYLKIRSHVGIRPCVWRVVGKKVIAFAWHRLIRRLGSLLFVLAKSNQLKRKIAGNTTLN